ncbi:hypothetical protein [Aeoliella sp. SH292]|uniref:hypothetical protein n=1 Tax=Aeoliella sp. SH292 TaxID=3454464 RepID=UPI003F996D3B
MKKDIRGYLVLAAPLDGGPTLEELIPGYLAEVPADPFTGKPLKMLVRADELRVYSVGKNLADDGGEEVIEANPDGALAPSGPDVVLRVKPE